MGVLGVKVFIFSSAKYLLWHLQIKNALKTSKSTPKTEKIHCKKFVLNEISKKLYNTFFARMIMHHLTPPSQNL